MDGDGRHARISGQEAREMHREVSVAQGKLSGSLGKAGESRELGFFSLQMGVSVEEDGFTVLIVRSLQEGRWQEVVVRLEEMASK